MVRRNVSITLASLAALSTLPVCAHAGPGSQPDPLDIVVVTAVREVLDAERALTPGKVTTVDGSEQFRRTVDNMADLMRYVPGAWMQSASGASGVFMSSRGSNLDATNYDNNGIKLLQDGLPVTAADGNNHNRFLDAVAAQYVTFAHGANALTYGASTLGGAIDFTTPTARTTDPMALFLSGASFGRINGRAAMGGVAGDLDGIATVDYVQADGYRVHSHQRRASLYTNGAYQWNTGVSTRLFVTWIDSEEQMPGSLTQAEFEEDPRQAAPSAVTGNFQWNVETVRIAQKTTWTIGTDGALDFGLSWEHQSLYHPIVDRIMVDFDGSGPAPPVEVFSLLVDMDQDIGGANLRYQRQAGSHALLFGANYSESTARGGNYRNLNGKPNGLRESVDNSAGSLELFAMDRWAVGPGWTLVYGAQFVDADREVKVTNATSGAIRNPQGNYSSLNPRVGVLYATGDSAELYANASRVFEPPTNYELEDDVRGNSTPLDAMHGTSYEVGWRGRTGSAGVVEWNWDFAAYYAAIRDEILSVDNPAAPGTSLATNIDRTTHAGFEGLVGVRVPMGTTSWLEPLLSVTLNDFSFDSDPSWGNNHLPVAPRYFARGEVMVRHGALRIGPTFEFVGRRHADFANGTELGSYGLLGLRGSYSADRWEAFAEIRNLLDRDYVANVTAVNEASADSRILTPGSPLSAAAGVRVSF
jgi:iron complex outermembrane receptor protein